MCFYTVLFPNVQISSQPQKISQQVSLLRRTLDLYICIILPVIFENDEPNPCFYYVYNIHAMALECVKERLHRHLDTTAGRVTIKGLKTRFTSFAYGRKN